MDHQHSCPHTVSARGELRLGLATDFKQTKDTGSDRMLLLRLGYKKTMASLASSPLHLRSLALREAVAIWQPLYGDNHVERKPERIPANCHVGPEPPRVNPGDDHSLARTLSLAVRDSRPGLSPKKLSNPDPQNYG